MSAIEEVALMQTIVSDSDLRLITPSSLPTGEEFFGEPEHPHDPAEHPVQTCQEKVDRAEHHELIHNTPVFLKPAGTMDQGYRFD